MLENILIVVVVTLIAGLALWYVIRQKKRGVKCIGCPAAASCGKAGGCNESCQGCSHMGE